jgi:hypothetical protein
VFNVAFQRARLFALRCKSFVISSSHCLVCQEFTDTVFVYDITHKAATILKRELSTEEKWNEFTRLATSTRKQVQQTQLAAIAPPNQRSKARYMNVEPLIKWGLDKLYLLDNPDGFSCLECTKDHITQKLGWLTDFRRDLEEWKELIHIIKEAEIFIKFQIFLHIGVCLVFIRPAML